MFSCWIGSYWDGFSLHHNVLKEFFSGLLEWSFSFISDMAIVQPSQQKLQQNQSSHPFSVKNPDRHLIPTVLPPTTSNMPAQVKDNQTSVREEMQMFWEEHSIHGSIQEMMLDETEQVEEVGKEEASEILSLLPDYTGINVLELGAGIGRFTGTLAQKAKSVVAVDFMESFICKNEKTHGHLGNIKFVQADATKLEQPENSLDQVFSNWLLMYLTEEEVRHLFNKILKWLRPGGYLFFRESCFHQSGTKSRQFNPTKYRDPALYNALIQSVSAQDAKQRTYGFEVVLSRSVQTYIKHKNNSNQVCWLLQKVQQDQSNNHGYKTFQEFLDNQQYSMKKILTYEKAFGRNFLSPGGKETAKEFLGMLDLQKDQYVLDVGSGIGGSAFFVAQEYGAHVLGIDLSANMVSLALERANEIKDRRVQFEIGDATKRQFPKSTFDVVYSRDTIVHIKGKEDLLKKFYSWLKPGGKLLISDYCCSQGKWSENFQKYITQRGYHLLSVNKYGELLKAVGFQNVSAQDRTEQFTDILTKELSRLQVIKEQFVQEFSEKDYEDITNGWQRKIDWCGQGEQKWGLFYAEKPPN